MLFEEASERYSHIDGELLDYNFSFNGDSFVKIDFFPWWENPKYHYAVSENLNWRAKNSRKITMTIKPIGLIKFSFEPRCLATDISFLLDDPLLWEYYDKTQLFINEQFDYLELRQKLILRYPIIENCINNYLPMNARHNPPYCLGDYPTHIYNYLVEILTEMKVSIFPKNTVSFQSNLKLVYIDEANYIIADDFIIDVPEVIFQDDDFYIEEK
ncbi:hypothetical protein [Leptospira koniambonensis]|uniref:hypothetical protein n=1 Tax=Leptospira koniambonensis TaxID=2484950 RepID=UPI003EBFFEC2